MTLGNVGFQNASYANGGFGLSSYTTFGGSTSPLYLGTEGIEQLYDNKHTYASFNAEEAASQVDLQRQISVFAKYMESHEEDKALAAYEQIIDTMKNMPEYARLEDVAGMAEVAITKYLSQQAGKDVDLAEYIEDNSVSASGRSWQRTFFNNNKIDTTTTEELLNTICGYNEDNEVTFGQKALEFVVCTVGIPVKALTELGDFLFGGKHH